jgi:MFS transporter, DHA2 family, multidrug resistance protein
MQEQMTYSQPPPASSPIDLSPSQSKYLLIGLALATGMEFYTFDSINLILPDMTGSLGVSFDEASWILTVYSSFLFLGVPLSFWLAAHFGYKRFLIWSTALFAMMSVGAALSPTLGIMLVFRAIEGLAGAALAVWWRGSIYMLLPREKRSPSMMTSSVRLYFASAGGLILSGFLTDRLNWRLICVPNVFLAFAAIRLLKKNFPDLPKNESLGFERSDYPGLILAAIGFLSLQVILSRGHIDDWFGSPRIRLLAVISAVAIVAFVYWERRADNSSPLMRMSSLTDRNVLAAAFIGIFAGMILSGSLFVLPEFLRLVDTQTHSATQTGRLIAFYALAGAALRPLMSKVMPKLGPRKMAAVSFCMLIAAMLLFYRCLTTSTPDGYFLLPLALYAGCLTTLLPSIGQGTYGKLGPRGLLDGMQIYVTFRQLGASLGVAFLTILLERRETLHSSRLYEHLNAANETTSTTLNSISNFLYINSGASHAGSGLTPIGLLAREGAQQVETLSYADCFLFMAMVAALAFFFIPLMAPFVAPAKATAKLISPVSGNAHDQGGGSNTVPG